VYKLLDHGGYVLYVGWAKEGQLRKRIVERRVAPEASAFCYKLCAMETEAEREKEKPTVEYMPRYNQQTR
jgi:excinuclease UvrABC nuclease subunit